MIRPKRGLPGTRGGLVLAAARSFLPHEFTKEDLAVRCFQISPADFALDGYPDLVSSNKVYPRLTELVEDGKIEHLGMGVFRAKGKRRR